MTLQEFANLFPKGQPEIGSYDIGYYDEDGNHRETQLDVHVGDTVDVFYERVCDDLLMENAGIEDVDYVEEALPDAYLIEEIWQELGDVAIDDRDYLLENFNGYEAGNHTKFDVWRDMEERWGIVVGELINGGNVVWK